MFKKFLLEWLRWRYVETHGETQTFHKGDIDEIPAGYYAVVTVQLKPIVTEVMAVDVVEEVLQV